MTRELDAKIVKGELAWKTAASVWTLVTSVCADMVTAKRREFRVRDDNPCRDVKPPERGARKAKQYLYPSEFLTFVSCETVPLRWRRAVTLAIYTYARDGELRALRWDEGDIDLEHGILSITRAYDRRNPSETKSTKSETPRRFAIEPALLPLLRALHAEARGKGAVAPISDNGGMAHTLRRWLWKAGVQRPELHEGSSTRKPMTWHDLRGWRSAATTRSRSSSGLATRRSVRRKFTFARLRPFGKGSAMCSRRCPKISPRNRPGRYPVPDSIAESPRLETVRDDSQRLTTGVGAELSDAEIERAIVVAMLEGRGAVAGLLAERLKARRLARAGAVDLEAERARLGR